LNRAGFSSQYVSKLGLLPRAFTPTEVIAAWFADQIMKALSPWLGDYLVSSADEMVASPFEE